MRPREGAAKSAVALFVIIVFALAAALVVYRPTQSSSSTSSSSGGLAYVNVFGIVSTLGAGTHPTAMIFLNAATGQTFEAPVSNGHFSVQLPNGVAYAVSMKWAGNYSWQTGETSRGQLTVNMSAGSSGGMSYNDVVETPEAVVAVSGTITWQMVTASPAEIRFTATDGQNFTAAVGSDKTFSIHLPNMMNYTANIHAVNATTGYSDWFYAHTLDVQAGTNVLGLTVRIG